MHGLSGSNADENTQYLDTVGSLCHRGIEAVTSLFDGREVEGCGVRDRLQEIGIRGIGVSSGNGRMLPHARVGIACGNVKLGSRLGL
jgi:hypothetical protein